MIGGFPLGLGFCLGSLLSQRSLLSMTQLIREVVGRGQCQPQSLSIQLEVFYKRKVKRAWDLRCKPIHSTCQCSICDPSLIILPGGAGAAMYITLLHLAF